MAITAKQKDERKNYLGSSDMAAVMGFDPFRNAYDVWLEKAGKLEPAKNDGETKATKRGKYLEPGLLYFSEDELGPLERNPAKLEFTDSYLISHPDALFNNCPVEAKSQGDYSKEVWGDDGTDQVPDRVIIQCHVHLICTNKKYCYVPVYLPYREFQMLHVEYDRDVAKSITEAAQHFWEEHVLKDIPPEDVVPALAVVKRIRREPATIVELQQSLVDDWLAKKEISKLARAEEDKAESAMLAALDQAEGGKTEKGLLTYYQYQRQNVDSKRLRAEMPEIAEKYINISKYRRPVFKEAKNVRTQKIKS